MQLSRVNEVLTNTSDNDDDAEQRRENVLNRNLLKDPAIGESDCAFRTIVSQIRKTVEWSDPSLLLWERLTFLGLGMDIDMDADILQIHQLFVDDVESNDYYQMLTGIPSIDLNAVTERCREPGTFCSDVGDLVIKVCSDILQVPIIVITSTFDSP